ncbi:MAG: orotidine-5'-phosphate decarboxylase [Firmicutes bacterium]|nr:orotidine-5'-phosphate decarboxylase [Bacillota bacterium]
MITDILIDKILEKENPSVVGLDPRPEYIPQSIFDICIAEYGKTAAAVAEAYLRFNIGIIEAVADIVPAVKPQIAMYEQFGPEGLIAYVRTVDYARQKGLVVIGDVKRGDIASTAEAYSDAHLGTSSILGGEPFAAFDTDYITINPYMGYDSIEPYLENCKARDKGLFILVKTSNPGSSDFQDLKVGDKALYQIVGESVEKWGEPLRGRHGYSALGAVVGATHPKEAAILREAMPHTFFLVPGYGAQGAGADDIRFSFDKNGLGAIVNSSRGIIAAHKKDPKFSDDNFADAAREAALAMKADLMSVWKK